MTHDEIIELAGSMFNKGNNAEAVAFVKAIAAKEREECAKVCEDLSKMFSSGDEYMDGVLDCIDAIRARGE